MKRKGMACEGAALGSDNEAAWAKTRENPFQVNGMRRVVAEVLSASCVGLERIRTCVGTGTLESQKCRSDLSLR